MITDCMRAFVESAPVDGPIRLVAGTEGRKIDGRDYRMAGMDLSRYEANPVVLWSHDQTRPPIGRGVPSVEGDKLLLDVTFDTADPFAAEVDGKYRRGFLNAMSMTAVPTDGAGNWLSRAPRGVIERSELIEVSAVPIPLDPMAVRSMTRSASVELAGELIDLGTLLREAATAAAELDDPQIDDPDEPGGEASSQGTAPEWTDETIERLAAALEAKGFQKVTPPSPANDLDALSAIAAALPTPKEG